MTSAMDNTIARHVRRTLVLAWPMILNRVGIIAMGAVDVVVLGRAGATELADYVLGQAIQDSLIAMTIGLLIGVPVLVAREAGAGNAAAAGRIWRRGLGFGLGVGAALALALQAAEPLFLLLGQAPDLAARAAAVTRTLALGLPFIAAFFVSASFLEALHRPLVGLVAVTLGNLANLGLSIALVFGAGPLPAMGAVGCALATVLTFATLAIGLGVWVRLAMPERARFGVTRPAGLAPPAREQFGMGLASGGAHLFEASSFAVMTLFIGLIGPLALAAHGVLFQFLALTFMVAFGIAGATQIRVGNAWGRGDPRGVRLAGWTGLGLAALLTGAVTLAFIADPGASVRLFTDEPEVIAAAAPVLVWVAFATVFDGGQAVMNQACRGRGDTWFPTALHFGSYWLVMVPAAWVLAFTAGQGLAGVYQAIMVASVFSLGALALRFRALSRAAP